MRVSLPFILVFKGCEENLPVAIDFLKIGFVWNFSVVPAPDTFLRATVINSPTGLVNWRCH